MQMNIKQIKPKEHRYKCYQSWGQGDYWVDDEGIIQFRIAAKTQKDFYIYFIHEYVEAMLCRQRGIKWEKIDKFDNEHSSTDDPGSLKDAPYHKEHLFANKIENLLSKELSRGK